jgi:putative component of membrane protein insertase Oxa1/YidC/SpoIIIJ protein YidD
MKILALAAISFYQRYLSPLKGFNCAFRRHTGRDSCSAYGKRVIARHGLPVGLELLRRRLDDCHEIHQHYHPAMPAMSKRHRAQAGNCDLSCDASDVADVLGAPTTARASASRVAATGWRSAVCSASVNTGAARRHARQRLRNRNFNDNRLFIAPES